MKKSYWRLLVATVLVAVALLIKTTSDGQFKYTYTYFFSDYTHSFNELSKKYKIDFIYSVDESFIDPSLIGVSLINKAENISDFELSRYSVLLADIFSEYPENVIKDEISTIKLASTLTLFGVSYGGTSINSTLYLTSSGLENGYSDIYIKELFHHEFSSILMRKHHFPTEKWAKFNSINFKYAQNASDILEAISKDKGTEGNNLLYKNGFLTKYSMSTLENDVNTYAETIFTNPLHLKYLISNYPIIKNKYLLLKKFYLNIDPDFKNIFDDI